MERTRHATSDVDEKDRLTYWTDLVCATFVNLNCSARRDGFAASIENATVGDVQISAVLASSQSVSRRRANIARSRGDYFLLSVQTHGTGCILQDGRVAQLRPGDLALYDTTRPYELRFPEDFGQLVLRLPRSNFSSNCRMAERLTALRIPGDRGTGLLASNLIRQAGTEVLGKGIDLPNRLNLIASDLVALALTEEFGVTSEFNDARQMLRCEIEAFIHANFHLPTLTCEVVAERHRISERYLRKVFEGSPVSEIIWSKRLETARMALEDPSRRTMPISAIGYSVGFKDTGHFSRSFKARFGSTPRDWRARASGPRWLASKQDG